MDTAVVDCDTHYYEPAELWHDFIDPAYRDQAPELVNEGGRVMARIGDRLFPAMPGHPGLGQVYGPDETLQDHIREDKAISTDADARLAAMDATSVATQVIYPTLGMVGFASIDDANLAAACARAYNRYCADFAERDPQRLKPAMMLPIKHPEHAVRELEFAREELGLDIAFVNPTPPRNTAWSDEIYSDFWASLVEHDVTFTFHEAAVAAGPETVGVDRYGKLPQLIYLCTHSVEPMLAISDLIFGGVLEAHEDLRVGMLEAHITWIPGWLDLLDFKVGSLKAGESKLGLSMLPSEYFRRHCFAAAFPDDPGIADMMDRLGEDNIVYSSDWPHTDLVPDEETADAVGYLSARTDLTPERKERLLVTNPRCWLALDK